MKHTETACHFAMAASAIIYAGSAYALQDYRCTIQRVLSFGTMQSESAQKYWEDIHRGKVFTVERRSGVMAGVLKNSYVTKPQVIDFGSDENAFKAVSTMRREQGAGAGSSIYALVINEYEPQAAKTFVFLQNNTTYTGVCEHF